MAAEKTSSAASVGLRPVAGQRTRPGWAVIVNPHSRGNRDRAGRAEALQRAAGPGVLVRQPHTLDDLRLTVSELLRRGVDHWLIAGGDGTLHQVLRLALGLLEKGAPALPTGLPAMLPSGGGTVNVVARAADVRRSAEALLRLVGRSTDRPLRYRQVDTMAIAGSRRVGGRLAPFRTVGFAAAVGGVGQRFFAALYRQRERGSLQIARILGRSALSWLGNRSPLRGLMDHRLRRFEQEIFRPTSARVTVDGATFERTALTGINVASLPVNLGHVLRVFGGAAQPGRLHALYGAARPAELIRKIPLGAAGLALASPDIVDAPCQTMTVEALGDELLAPVIDGEYYTDVQRITFRVGEPLRIPLLGA